MTQSSLFIGTPQRLDVDLYHLQHCLHRFLAPNQLTHVRGNDLPGEAELVGEPAALYLLASGRKLLPKVVDLLLRVTLHDQRDGRREGEPRTAVESHDLVSVELEHDHHDSSLRTRPGVSVAADLLHPRVREDRDVEVRGFFGVVVEPEKWRDVSHGNASPPSLLRDPIAQPLFPFADLRRGVLAEVFDLEDLPNLDLGAAAERSALEPLDRLFHRPRLPQP